MFKIKYIIILFSVGIIFTSCKNDSPVETAINYESPDSTPEEQGMDSKVLATAFSNFQKYSGVYSLLVMRNGKIVAEQYYNGKNKDSYTNIASISKSFISALTGIALKEQLIDSLKQRLPDFFPTCFQNEPDSVKREITIENLLTMTSGLKPITDASNDWLSIPDIISYAIALPLLGAPGKLFGYNTSLTHMLAKIISNKSGKSTFDYAKNNLFDKLGITCSRWDKDLFGNYIGGTDMYFTPRDLLKLGYLYLNDGKLNGVEIIPAEWVKASITPFIKVEQNYYYCYNWWRMVSSGSTVFFAEGYGGQYIFVFKDYNLVVVATSNPYTEESNTNIVSREFFTANILPAISN
jgi:CubicO group peptidase (beta-lactamase class C family)